MTTRVTAPPSDPLPAIDSLIVPVSPDTPAGEWLRFDAVYDDIRRLREEDDATLPQGVWQRELKRADWPGVAKTATETLAGRSKDLQLAAWATEAWVRTAGFAGLTHGIRLITALCGAFWETLYPAIEEGSVASRVAPINWLASEKFLLAVKSIPITAPAGEEGSVCAWKEWETARRDATQPAVLASASLTPAPFYAALARDLTAAVAAIDELQSLLRTRLGEADAPSLTPLRTLITDVAAFVKRVRQDEEVPMESVEAGLGLPESESAPAATGAYTGPIASRADAYQRLREASDFLLRTEPHSPVPYLVRRAISWGNMPLAEVLEQLLQKNTDLATIYTLLGIKESEKKGR